MSDPRLNVASSASVLSLAVVAERMARVLHRDQEDKQGKPYIEHLARVASMVDTDEMKAVAWLHDAFEDTNVTPLTLLNEGLTSVVLSAVIVLTRREFETYHDYIRRVVSSQNEVAIAVKWADLNDNLRPGGLATLTPRYRAALDTIRDWRASQHLAAAGRAREAREP